jgi:hypothetical protein
LTDTTNMAITFQTKGSGDGGSHKIFCRYGTSSAFQPTTFGRS